MLAWEPTFRPHKASNESRFGVAKVLLEQLSGEAVQTEIGQIVGTLEYMSPEQAQLSNADVDTRADIYSLGVLLYELLTGSTPLDRPRLKGIPLTEILRRIREDEAPHPAAVWPRRERR